MSRSFTTSSRPVGVTRAGRGRGAGTIETKKPANRQNRTMNYPAGGGYGGRPAGAGQSGPASRGGIVGTGMPRDPNTNIPQNQQQNNERKLEYRGGYSMMAPDEKKRSQIERQAQKEADNYERYKDNNRVQHVNYVGTVGGGELTEVEARQKTLQSQLNRRQIAEKSRQYRAETRRREEQENEMRKADGRRKADDNKIREQQRQDSLKNDHERKNEAFLRRLEQQQNRR
ncbi:uncharacterized protein LOC141910925 [Tubulanus polymorphus]|uniref:uncharacterized protein LOC141910925 n=1 Tax=Tubulanus polymorphus TaxID=672921 RepID=UPI003DA648CF